MPHLQLLNPEEVRAMNREPHYWLGRMSGAVGEAVTALGQKEDVRARRDLRSTLKEFVDSPVPSEELREHLRGYLR